MASDRVRVGIDELLRAARLREGEGQTDGQLLGQFLAQRDEAAFALLLRRHCPMVLGVCQRILGNAEDADDAFQAVFVVLVRKAASLTARAVLGDWLHGVARRTALNARRTAARHREKERAMARPETQHEEGRDNRLILLDEALSRLPEKYRLAIVLCELEGLTRREAGERLGWPEGTVAGRLARGRELLARQLRRRGLGASAGALAAGLFGEAASANVPAALASSTIKTALLIAAGQAAATGAISVTIAALAEGVIRQMFLNTLKIAMAVVLVTVLFAAGGMACVVGYLGLGKNSETEQQAGAPQHGKEKSRTPQRKNPVLPGAEKKSPAAEEADKEDRIRPGDLIKIQVAGLISEDSINGVYQVEKSGKVALGIGYGRVNIKGLTLEKAEEAIFDHLSKIAKQVAVQVTRPIPENLALERRVRDLENEVRELRSRVDELRNKAQK